MLILLAGSLSQLGDLVILPLCDLRGVRRKNVVQKLAERICSLDYPYRVIQDFAERAAQPEVQLTVPLGKPAKDLP